MQYFSQHTKIGEMRWTRILSSPAKYLESFRLSRPSKTSVKRVSVSFAVYLPIELGWSFQLQRPNDVDRIRNFTSSLICSTSFFLHRFPLSRRPSGFDMGGFLESRCIETHELSAKIEHT